MAQLDRFLTALVSNNAAALLLATDDVARLDLAGVPRPITKQPLTESQVLGLVREIAPASAHPSLDGSGECSFHYRTSSGAFVVRLTRVESGLTARIAPGDAEPEIDAASAAAETLSARGTPSAPPVRRASASITVEPEVEAAARAELERLLGHLVEQRASDLHLRVGEPPIIRKDGVMARLAGMGPLAPDTLEAMIVSIMSERTRTEFAERNDADFAHELEGLARFRCNALRERRGVAAVFRVVPARIASAEELGLSEEVQRLCHLPRGLVLVTGPTGSGKSTTLHALVDLINRTRTEHVITIEDPIEFVHENKKCIITQRQVGVHTGSFKSALRAALREDPDVILIGELRDLETVAIAIETAETGHLVFGTLHTTGAASTIDRVIDQFPADRQEQVRVMLSESLKGVISQTLCRKIGGGRVAAREVLLTIPSLSNLIREGKTFQIPSVMQTSKRLGMVTLNDALLELVDRQQIEAAEAYLKANDKTAIIAALKQRGHEMSFLDPNDAAAAAPAPAGNGAARPAAKVGAR